MKLTDEKPFETCLANKDLVFILLQKKERKLLEKVLPLSPSLIDELDGNGYHLSCYVCLKVHGCRNRLVDMLI
ncbi:hypothetical protein I4U23_011196 [Adineta vaga]|nr:hypothetical protein I4U23_011196 [Adineta vaga]